MLDHQSVGVCEVSYTYLLRCLKKHGKDILISCSVVNMVVTWLVIIAASALHKLHNNIMRLHVVEI